MMFPPLSPRYGLAIHTASADLGLAISNFAGDSRCQVWPLGREVSNYLHLCLDQFMQPQCWSDLAFLAVASGPGGFTGTRLGVVTARTLAQQLDLPLFSISTLAAVAWAKSGDLPAQTDIATDIAIEDIAIEMSAHRGDIYAGIYRLQASAQLPQFTAVMADGVLSPDQWQQNLADWPHRYQRITASSELGDTSQSVLELAYLHWLTGLRPHWSEALPFYGQSPV